MTACCPLLGLMVVTICRIAQGVQIWPYDPELTLISGANLTLKCTGDVPVKWNHNQYDQCLLTDNHFSNSTHTLKILSQLLSLVLLLDKNRFISLLPLSRASYLDTGYYYCDTLSEGLKKDEQNSNKIYIFIQDDTHLLAVPNDFVELSQDEFDNVIIPCRPTSPDVNVTLMKDDEMLVPGNKYGGTELHYDAKCGFLLLSVTVLSSGAYLCNAKFYDKEQFVSYQLTIRSKVHKVVKPYINSNVAHSDHIITGQNLSLNCSVSMDLGISFALHWIVPDNQKLKDGHVQIGKEHFFNGLIHGINKSIGSRLLNIQNVTTEDEGDYICEVIVHTEDKSYAVYTLETFTPGITYLNLTVQGSVYERIRRSGFIRVQWIIRVSAYPEPSLIWTDPNGKELGMDPEKISVENKKRTSKLVIKDLELNDSGVYVLEANNDVHKARITVSLLVEDRPFIQTTNNSDARELYKVEKEYIFKCSIAGYPLPYIEWAFKKCANYPKCEESYIQLSRTMHEETVVTKTFLTSTVIMTATVSGILLCSASNNIGNASHNFIFLVTDLPNNGLAIKGPPVVDKGDNVKIKCGASKYSYRQDIKWTYESSTSSEESQININNSM